MGVFAIHELVSGVRARIIRPMPSLSDALEREVELLWAAAQARMAAGGAGVLFNGQVFSADAIAPHQIEGHMTEYRRIVAQMERPDLFDELRVRPLAVNGMLRGPGGIAIGRRHPDAIYQPGLWQMPPAGSVDAGAADAGGHIDLRRQLLTELQEELGLTAAHVGEPSPLCIVEHTGSHVLDLGMELRTRLSGPEILAIHRMAGNGEYAPLRVVAEAELEAFVADAGETLVPSARVFLRHAGLIAG